MHHALHYWMPLGGVRFQFMGGAK